MRAVSWAVHSASQKADSMVLQMVASLALLTAERTAVRWDGTRAEHLAALMVSQWVASWADCWAWHWAVCWVERKVGSTAD